MPLGVCLSLNKYYTKNTLALRRMLASSRLRLAEASIRLLTKHNTKPFQHKL